MSKLKKILKIVSCNFNESYVFKGYSEKRIFFSISDVSSMIGVPKHVLRYWGDKINILGDVCRKGNRRMYKKDDVILLSYIKNLIYVKGYTVDGANKHICNLGLHVNIDEVPFIDGKRKMDLEWIVSELKDLVRLLSSTIKQ